MINRTASSTTAACQELAVLAEVVAWRRMDVNSPRLEEGQANPQAFPSA